MKLKTLLLLLIILPFSAYLRGGVWDNVTNLFGAGEKDQPPSIRVLIVHDIPKAHMEVKGKYSLYDPYKNVYLSTRFIGKARDLETLSDGLKWGEAFPGLYQLQIRPEDGNTSTSIDRKEYAGLINIYDIGGALSVVNDVQIEEYVRSIVSNFNNENYPNEVMAALSIVARTNAYYQAAHPKTNFWAIDAQKVGYNGIPQSTNNALKAEDAVRITKNMIMSNTGIYEGMATPFLAEFGPIALNSKEAVVSKISLQEAVEMAKQGAHAAQILAKAFPGITIMLSK